MTRTRPTAAAQTCLRRRNSRLPGIMHRRLQITADLRARLPTPGGSTAGRIPAWLTIPDSAHSAFSQDMPPYLRVLQRAMGARIETLTDLAVATRPDWIRAFGEPPVGGQVQTRWRWQIAIVAAWREQHDVTTGHVDVLGPRPDPGHGAESAWRYAADALKAGRKLAVHDADAFPESETPADRQRALREARHAASRELAVSGGGRQHRDRRPVGPASTDLRRPQEQEIRLVPPSQQQRDRPITW
jgi:hypothetical protein